MKFIIYRRDPSGNLENKGVFEGCNSNEAAKNAGYPIGYGTSKDLDNFGGHWFNDCDGYKTIVKFAPDKRHGKALNILSVLAGLPVM